MDNWRIFGTGFYYVSKSGSNAAGTTGSTSDPFLTIQAAVHAAEAALITTVTIVVGAGEYNEDIIFNYHNANYQLLADGRVVLSGLSSGGSLLYSSNIALFFSFEGFEFESIGDLWTGSGGGPSTYSFSDCIFRDVTVKMATTTTFSRCILITSTIYSGGPSINKCTFIGSNIGLSGINQIIVSLTNSFFDGTSQCVRLYEPTVGVMDYNNHDFGAGSTVEYYRTTLTMITTIGALQSHDGSWNQHSIGQAPGFNGFAPEDYTLNPSSPMAYTASDGKHIGAYDLAVSQGTFSGQAFNDTAPGFSANLSEVMQTANGWVLASGVSESTITSGYIDLGSLQTVGVIRLFATQFGPGDVVDHDNTPDNPNRQTYELSWGADTGSLGSFELMEWGKRPTVNLGTGGGIARGNGDPDFDVLDATMIQAKVLQLRVTIRNNGLAG